MVICTSRFSHRQEVHILLQRRHISQMNSARFILNGIWQLINSNTHFTPVLQSSTPCRTGTSMDQFAKRQPTHLENYSKGRCDPLFLFPKRRSPSYMLQPTAPGVLQASKKALLASTKDVQQIVPTNGLTRFLCTTLKQASKSTNILETRECLKPIKDFILFE